MWLRRPAPNANASASPGTIYVGIGGEIDTFDAKGKASLFGYTDYQATTALAVDRNGTLYAATTGNVIWKFDPSGNRSLFANTASQISGLAVDASGFLYAATLSAPTVLKYDSQGQSSVFATTPVSPSGGLAFDPSGDLYVATEGNSKIWKYDALGNASQFGPSVAAYAIAYSGSSLYVVTPQNTINKIDTAGNSTLFSKSGVSIALDMASDGAGNLYVISGSPHKIVEFDQNGVPTQFASGSSYQNIAIVPVPEPSLSAMLALALGLSFTAYGRKGSRR